MGACTIANRRDGVQNNKRVVEADVTFSTSYTSGGDSVDPVALGLHQVDAIQVVSHLLNDSSVAVSNSQAREGASVQLTGTATAPTLRLSTAEDTQATAATNNSTRTFRIRFLGS